MTRRLPGSAAQPCLAPCTGSSQAILSRSTPDLRKGATMTLHFTPLEDEEDSFKW